jgi:hypothetical protein
MCVIVRDLQFEAFVNDVSNGVTTRDFRLDCAGERCAGRGGRGGGLEKREWGVCAGSNTSYDNILVSKGQGHLLIEYSNTEAELETGAFERAMVHRN